MSLCKNIKKQTKTLFKNFFTSFSDL